MKRALLLVDLQNDFLPGGSLAVPHGDQVLPFASSILKEYDLVCATLDWHPPDHGSFVSQHPGTQVGDVVLLDGLEQVVWPEHCVADSQGAQLSPALSKNNIDHYIRKGTRKHVDSYSGFFDNARRHQTGLHETLSNEGISELHVMGLATDYCVKYTVLDALELGYSTTLLIDGCRGVNLRDGDCDEAIRQMQLAGARLRSREP